MLIKTIKVTTSIEYTPEHEAYINPYYGCTAGCPFCYWLSFEDWENKLEAIVTPTWTELRMYMG